MHIWFNLFRKEWLEHRWKLASLCVIAMTLFLALGYGEWEEVPQTTLMTCIGFAFVATIFVGMAVSAAEPSNGTMSFVASQPVALWQSALVRWLCGMGVILIPIVLVGFSGLLVELFDPDSRSSVGISSWHAIISGGVMAANLYAWIVAIAVNQRTELRAALIGLVVAFVLLPFSIWCLAYYDGHMHSRSSRDIISPFAVLGVMTTPLSGFAWMNSADQMRKSIIPLAVIWQMLVLTMLCGIMTLRYGQLETFRQRVDRWRQMRKVGELRQPRTTSNTALVWLQWRESIPVCFCGVAIGFVMFVVTSFPSIQGLSLWRGLIPLFLMLTTAVVSLMIGAVGFTNDLQPKLYAFWRSRPIAPTQWFWLRYGAGYAAIALFYLMPVTMFITGTAQQHGEVWLLAFLPLMSLVVYSWGVLTACTVRQPVYAVILAACGAMMILLIPEVFPVLRPVSIGDLLWQVEHRPLGRPVYEALRGAAVAVAIAFSVSVIVTVAAAVSLKRDLHFRV
ncbi:MAG: hypothetical protein R3C02_02385 [Planctomycetaceae bacterium]